MTLNQSLNQNQSPIPDDLSEEPEPDVPDPMVFPTLNEDDTEVSDNDEVDEEKDTKKEEESEQEQQEKEKEEEEVNKKRRNTRMY